MPRGDPCGIHGDSPAGSHAELGAPKGPPTCEGAVRSALRIFSARSFASRVFAPLEISTPLSAEKVRKLLRDAVMAGVQVAVCSNTDTEFVAKLFRQLFQGEPAVLDHVPRCGAFARQ